MNRRRAVGSGLVLLLGAGLYAALEGVVDVRFSATPLILGTIAVIAGVVGSRSRVTATGLVLGFLGVAVLLVDLEVVPGDRTTPAYMLGVGVGLVVAAAVATSARRGEWLASGASAAVLAPLSLYLAYDIEAMGRWPFWALILLPWAGWELFWGLRGPESAGAS